VVEEVDLTHHLPSDLVALVAEETVDWEILVLVLMQQLTLVLAVAVAVLLQLLVVMVLVVSLLLLIRPHKYFHTS
jgi:hypothetical protein